MKYLKCRHSVKQSIIYIMYLHNEREDVKDLHFADKSEQEWVAAENGGRVLVILKGK